MNKKLILIAVPFFFLWACSTPSPKGGGLSEGMIDHQKSDSIEHLETHPLVEYARK